LPEYTRLTSPSSSVGKKNQFYDASGRAFH
jgi:hypothetical protein